MVQSPTAAQPSGRPLRTLLLWLAASGIVPLVLVLVWGVAFLVRERSTEAERAALNLSRALATAVEAEQGASIAILENMGISDELERADFRTFYAVARLTAEQRGWRQIVVYDADGHVLLRTSEPYGKSTAQVTEPKSLAQVMQTLAPVVGNIVESPRQPSGAFAVRVPVLREGKLVYVLTAVLPADIILTVLTRQKVPSGSVASVFDAAGHRVARSVQAQSPLPSPSLQALLSTGESQGVGTTFTREGVENHTGFTRLAGSGWVVVVGNSVAQANKGLYALLGALAAGLAASVALSALLAWWWSRRVLVPIGALKDGAAALGRGDALDLPPLRIAELEQVAAALRAAAGERDQSAQERNRAAGEREELVAQTRRALQLAEDAGRGKDQFLAMLGHELRNPLAPITTAVQLMALKGDERTVQERRIIERQLVHVTRLVDDLLDVSRITGGRLGITREPVRIGALLTQLVDSARPSLNLRTLALDLDKSVEHAWVAADEVRLTQVFNNLLVNAIKFTRPGGAIRVAAAVEGEQVRIEVRDTGVGIAVEDLERVFELFFQAPQSSDRAGGGLGLGLAIVRSLVAMHGGSVGASSDGIGQGTCVVVLLPLCEAPPAAAEPTPAPAAQGTGKVLVVDDNEDAADTCAAFLDISGYTVRVAYTPLAALEMLEQFDPQVAILDIGLPGMSGYELAGRIKSRPGGFSGKLVALTGYGQASDVDNSRRAGFDAHLTKPVSPDTLLELVEKLAGQSVAQE